MGLLAGNHLAHFDLMFAAPKLGFIFVPILGFGNAKYEGPAAAM